MEIQNLNLGQNEIIVARPHTLEGPTQAGRLVNEGCSPPETPTVTSIDLRRCGRPPQAPFYDRPIRAYGVVSQREAWKPGTDAAYIHAHVVHDRQPNTRDGSPCGILEWKEYVDTRPCSTRLTACHQQERSI